MAAKNTQKYPDSPEKVLSGINCRLTLKNPLFLLMALFISGHRHLSNNRLRNDAYCLPCLLH